MSRLPALGRPRSRSRLQTGTWLASAPRGAWRVLALHGPPLPGRAPLLPLFEWATLSPLLCPLDGVGFSNVSKCLSLPPFFLNVALLSLLQILGLGSCSSLCELTSH